MSQTNTSVIAPVRAFYDRQMLEKAKPHLVHTWFGQVRDIPMNASAQIKFRRYSLLNAATTALTEGQTPSGSALSTTDVSATVSQYGDFITLTDDLLTQTEDPLILEMNDILGQQAGNTFDQLCRDVLVAGTSVQYASSATSRVTVSPTMKMTAAEVREAVRTLKENNALKITSMIAPNANIDTVPVNACYVGVVHPDTTMDLKADPEWVPVENYPVQSDVMPGEVGKIDEVRFVETTNAKKFSAAGSTGQDVYATLIFAANAYGVTRIAGKALQTITKPLGSAGTGDPLDQRSTHGWKGYFVAKILNDSFMLRIEHSTT
jgi:N4-gp56 family major capsid protein